MNCERNDTSQAKEGKLKIKTGLECERVRVQIVRATERLTGMPLEVTCGDLRKAAAFATGPEAADACSPFRRTRPASLPDSKKIGW